MGSTVSTISGIISIAVIIFVGVLFYLAYNFFFGNGEGSPCSASNGVVWPFSGCNISAGLCCNGKCSKGPCTATPQGGTCVIDSDCAGWSTFGTIACCNNKCITKAWTGQGCNAKVAGSTCTEPSGTIWPFSGCDISAGLCCNGKCSASPCPPQGQGQPCTAQPPFNFWPFSGCDISAGMCCGATPTTPGVCSKTNCS